MVSGQSSLGKRTNCKSHTLNLPWRGVLAIAFNPSDILLTDSDSWFLSLINSSKTLPRLFTDSSETVGMRCPPTIKYTSLRTFPWLGRDFVISQVWEPCDTNGVDRWACRGLFERSASCLRRLWCRPWTLLRNGMCTTLPMRASWIPSPTAFRTICMASTKSGGEMAHPMAMPTCRGIQPVMHSFV